MTELCACQDSPNYAWLDKDHNYFTMDQIDDRYLLNILHFISKGGGYTSFIDDHKIKNLFDEADKRELEHPYRLQDAISIYEELLFMEEMAYYSYLQDHC